MSLYLLLHCSTLVSAMSAHTTWSTPALDHLRRSPPLPQPRSKTLNGWGEIDSLNYVSSTAGAGKSLRSCPFHSQQLQIHDFFLPEWRLVSVVPLLGLDSVRVFANQLRLDPVVQVPHVVDPTKNRHGLKRLEPRIGTSFVYLLSFLDSFPLSSSWL